MDKSINIPQAAEGKIKQKEFGVQKAEMPYSELIQLQEEISRELFAKKCGLLVELTKCFDNNIPKNIEKEFAEADTPADVEALRKKHIY